MPLVEPTRTAILLTAFGVLAAISALFSRAAERVGVPVALIFLGLGMLAGVEGLGRVDFSDYDLAFGLGMAALVLILFDGGLNTPALAVRSALYPAGILATVGVAAIAALVGLFARLFGFSWLEAFLLGSIVSSTDAAAVFGVLRGSNLHLKRRVGVTLEIESGANDPMAVILTLALTQALTGTQPLSWTLVPLVAVQLAVGGGLGVLIGHAGRRVLERARLPASGLYPVLTLGIAFIAFGLATLLQGSGFLAVYFAAIVLGNSRLPYKTGLLRVHDGLAWMSQVSMFVLLGLLVVPSQLVQVAGIGLGIALLLTFVARPLVVALCLAPFRYPWREVIFIGWIGLRGAVPIVLAVFPVLAGAPGAKEIFNVVFFIVVIGAIIPGATVRWVTRRMGLQSHEPLPPGAVLEIASTKLLKGEVMSFFIDPASAVSGSAIHQLPFPPGSSVMLIVRGDQLIAPKGGTILEPGDHVYLFCSPEDRPLVQLMFGRLEQE